LRERIVTARQAALEVLNAWFGREPPSGPGVLPLTAFQRAALARIQNILERHGGAVLADAVGLGKTYVALAVVADALAGQRTVAIVIPAALRRHWQQHLRKLPARWRNAPRLITHTALSFGRVPHLEAQLIVVDEAHALRNPNTRRYEWLSRLTPGARVLLLSATPINNTLIDLYSLIRLFADDHAFRDLGVTDLKEAFRRAPTDARAQQDVQCVVEAVVVRRARADVVVHAESRDDTTDGLRFPERVPPRAISYDLIASYGQAWSAVYSALEQLSFSWVTTGADPGVQRLMRIALLKRLESSVVAFAGSLRRHERLCLMLLEALHTNRWIAPATLRSLVSNQETDLQLPLESLLTTTMPRECDANALRASLQADRELLRGCLRRLREPMSQPDPKLAALYTTLDAHKQSRVLLFTQYRDTAVYLWKQLSRHTRAGLVHGSEARLGRERAARSTVVECFAPAANGARPPPDRLRLDVLITTDVLAEGLNLQDANVIVNYDVPWNPVTLMQRVGRLDRLGSLHETVHTLYFVPDRGLDELLGLMDRVEKKLHLIERTVGSDGAVLDSEASSPRDFMSALQEQAAPRAFAEATLVESLRARWLRERDGQKIEAGPVIAALPGNERGWLLVVHDGVRLRLLVATNQGVREDVQLGCRTLLLALDDDSASMPDAAPPWQSAIDWLEGSQAARALEKSNGRTPVEHAAARRVLDIIEANPPVRVLQRCERLLERLAQPLEHAARARLQSALENTATDAAIPVIDALAEALGPPTGKARRTLTIRRIAAIRTSSERR
jgi:hypothetical protein